MSGTAVARRFGEGPLSRVVALVYTLLAVEFLIVVTTSPGLVALLLLDRDASNVPLAALCLVPVGPAVCAALYAVHRHRGDLTDLRPWGWFWHGYRTSFAGSLRLWVPYLVWMTIFGVNVTHLAAAGVPRWWAGLLVVLAVAATLWLGNALVIEALFAFRSRDVARLAGYFLGRTWGVTLGACCLLVVAVAVTVLFSEAVLVLLAALLALALVVNARPLVAGVRRDFTA